MRLTHLALCLLSFNMIAAQENICLSLGDPEGIEPRIMGWNRDISWKNIYSVVHIHYTDTADGTYIPQDIIDDAMIHLNEEFISSQISFDHVATEYHFLDSSTIYNCFPWNYSLMEEYIEPLQWDTEEYMNIHVYPNMCGNILGFAFLYYMESNLADGVYVRNDCFGRYGNHLLEGRDGNKTLVHEAGHYCGLFHVFQGIDYCGEEETDCSMVNDRVCDTPPTKLNWSCENPICPPGAYNYEPNNHMDYYPDSCRTDFTAGQTSRMHAMLDSWRPGLASSEPYCAGDVDGDLVVGVEDLMQVLARWGTYYEGPADLDHDGFVGLQDFTIVLTNWQSVCYGALPEAIYKQNVQEKERGRSPFQFR